MKKLLLPLVLAPLMAFASPSAPGVIVETVTKDLRSGETTTSHMYVLGNDLVMEFADPRSGTSGSMVFLAEKGEWIMNDDANRKYTHMDRAAMEQMSAQMKAAMSQVEKMLESIPAAQREAMMNSGIPGMEMLQGGGLPVIEMRKTGETATKAGYPAERIDMYVGDRRTQEMWVTEWSNVDGAEQVREAMTGFAEMMRSFLEAMPTSMFGEGGLASFMDFENGLPVVTYELDEEGNPTTESVIQSFTEAEVDPEMFGPKPGYTKQDINFGMN